MRTWQKQRIVTPGDPKGVKQQHLNTTEQMKTTIWTANDQAAKKTESSLNQLK